MAISQHLSQYRLLQDRLTLCTDQLRLINMSCRVNIVDADVTPITFGGLLDPFTRTFTSSAGDHGLRFELGVGQLPPFEFLAQRDGTRFVCVGAMGAGKTEVLARAAIWYAMHFRNGNIGIVAPTRERLGIVRRKIEALIPPSWVKDTAVKPDGEPPYTLLVNGVKFQFVAAKSQAKKLGSPIQGYDWIAAFVDEEQNIASDAMADVVARGRAAPGGWYPVLSSCTISDDPEFRSRLAQYRADPAVEVYRMEATANPFVDPQFWLDIRHTMSPRQYNMRVLAIEESPERATYPDFTRERHIRAVPEIGTYYDVTQAVSGARAVVGYDPGALCDVSLLLKAYQLGDDEWPTWFVVDELTTRPGSAQRHAKKLVEMCKRHRLRPRDVVMRADPHGNTDSRPHVTVYREFQALGFAVKPAVYKQGAKGAAAARPGQLPKDARIGVVNTLLVNAANETRLYLAADERGAAVARDTATALEMNQRDQQGRAEMEKKDEHDLSHWVCALGYALYAYEHARLHRAPLKRKTGR